MSFAQHFAKLRRKSGKSKYAIAQYTGIDQAYLSRLESGEKAKPSREIVLAIALALTSETNGLSIYDIDELLMSAEYAPIRKRGL